MAHTLACLRFAARVTTSVARLATGWVGSPFAGRVSHPLDGYSKFHGFIAASNPLRPAGPGRTELPIRSLEASSPLWTLTDV